MFTLGVELLCSNVLVGHHLLSAIRKLVKLIVKSIVAILKLKHHPASVFIQSVSVHADDVLRARLSRQVCRLLKVLINVIDLLQDRWEHLVCTLQDFLELLARHVIDA